MSNSVHFKKPSRTEDVAPENNYRKYREALRSDFNNACGYCDSEDYLVDSIAFQIDHFAPQKKFPDLVNEYTNLVYSCRYCNNRKRAKWVSDDPNVSYTDTEGFIDPCDIAYDDHLARTNTGKIIALTPIGDYMVTNLNLTLLRHELLWKARKLKQSKEKLEILMERLPETSELRASIYKLLYELLNEYMEYKGNAT